MHHIEKGRGMDDSDLRAAGATTEVRGILVWRLEPDGQWRVAMEHIS